MEGLSESEVGRRISFSAFKLETIQKDRQLEMKELIAKLKQHGIEPVNLDARMASVRLRSMCSAAEIAASDNLSARVSQFYHEGPIKIGIGDNTQFNYERAADVMPTDDDYISVKFRAISKTVVPGHWIDWSKDDVLKASVQKLLGQTVYPNHDFTDINNWLGSVASVEWDEVGANSEGIPGINAEYKIDALMNPRIARGLLMKPPAIHSTSMTVLFKFEPSHQDIWNESRWRFCELLGEEVEGEIVRFIVTEILEFWEASLVFLGADRLAKKQQDELQSFGANAGEIPALPAKGTEKPKNSNEVKTMKVTKEQLVKLGLEFDGDDVPEDAVLTAAELTIDSLTETLAAFGETQPSEVEALRVRAEAGDKFVEKQRVEVTRLARLAELGAESGELPGVISKQIAAADFDTLVELEGYYKQKSADMFPAGGRSSVEDADAINAAAGLQAQPETTVGIF